MPLQLFGGRSPQAVLPAVPLSIGGDSQAVSISAVSAQSAAINAGTVIVTCTVPAFVRADTNPTALSDGTDRYLSPDLPYVFLGLTKTHKLAFKTGGPSGTAYITPI